MVYKEFRSENDSFKIRSFVDHWQPDKVVLIIKANWVPTIEIKMTKSDIVKLVTMLTKYNQDDIVQNKGVIKNDWCFVDDCLSEVCGGPHHEVLTDLGNEQLTENQEPIGKPVTAIRLDKEDLIVDRPDMLAFMKDGILQSVKEHELKPEENIVTTQFERDFGHDPELAARMVKDVFKAPEQRAEAQEFLDSLKENMVCGNPECPKAGYCNGECVKNF